MTEREEKLDLVLREVREVKQALLGVPPDHKGLIVRVDRVEQKVSIVAKLFWLAMSAAFAACAKAFWSRS